MPHQFLVVSGLASVRANHVGLLLAQLKSSSRMVGVHAHLDNYMLCILSTLQGCPKDEASGVTK